MHRITRTSIDRRAFTLIELLVVVAIIGVLLAILLPALGRGRDQARRVKCNSNFHQIYIGMSMYLGNHRQVAFWRDADPANGMDWYCWGGTETGNPIDPVWGTLFNEVVPRPVNPYVKNVFELFHCPSDRDAFWHDPSPYNHFEWLGNSYNFNSIRHPLHGGDPGEGLSGVNLHRVEEPDRTVLFYEAGTAKSPTIYWNAGDAFEWHPTGTGDFPGYFVMVDGSTEFMPLPKPTNTTVYWNAIPPDFP